MDVAILDYIADPVTITEFETGSYLYVNKAFEELSGFKSDYVLGVSPVDLCIVSLGERKKIKDALKAGNGKCIGIDVVYIKTSGERYFAGLSCTVMKYKGKKAIISTARDMTEYRVSRETKEDMKQMMKQMEHLTAGFQECAAMSDYLSDHLNKIMGIGGGIIVNRDVSTVAGGNQDSATPPS